MKKCHLRVRLVIASIFFALPLFAGGPLATLNGKPVRFKSDTISYMLDRGSFGIFTNRQAQDLANLSFKTWSDVPTSNVTFHHTDADTLSVDVNGTNFLEYTTLSSVKIDGINPIVFDSDGAIIDSLFGEGSSTSIIGFAWSEDTDGDGYFNEGEAFMNGRLADGSARSYTLEEWKSTFVHEFGHFLGLDHTQINGEFAGNALMTQYIPTMYPTATVNDVPLGDLNPDDIAAISSLYPAATFAATTGNISGTVKRADNSIVSGVNVIAIGTGADSLMNQISTITDYYAEASGKYTVTGLTSGSYNVRIEPIDQRFTGVSAVGPYAADPSGLSFINPITPEYYNGINESADTTIDNPLEKTAVPVTANATTANVNFVANKTRDSVLAVDVFSRKDNPAPSTFSLSQNYPNPFNPMTTIGYQVPTASHVSLKIYDVVGREVAVLVDEQKDAGQYTALFDASKLSSGVYFYRLGAESFLGAKKMVLMK